MPSVIDGDKNNQRICTTFEVKDFPIKIVKVCYRFNNYDCRLQKVNNNFSFFNSLLQLMYSNGPLFIQAIILLVKL